MNDLDLNYNYVIAGSGEYYLVGYHDIINMPCVSYHVGYNDGFSGFVQKQMLRWNFSRQLNKYLHTPFSWFVYPRLYPYSFAKKKPLCYVFFGNRQYIYQTSYLDYLRRHFAGVKIVLYMQDLVSRTNDLHIEKVANKFDLLLSYDQGDAKRYNMDFHPTPMSYVDVPDNKDLPTSDIYFCGFAKNRYELIHEVFRKCREYNLVCDFNILDLPENVKKVDGVHYPAKPFDYMTNLQHVKKTRCILEIMQEGADGFTPRLWESIIYDKHLLTNNKNVQGSAYYYANGCHDISMLSSSNVVPAIKKMVEYPKSIKASLSPIHLLQFIDKKLASVQ